MRRLTYLVAVALFPTALAAQGFLIPRPCDGPPPPCPRNADCRPPRTLPCPSANPIVRTSSEVHAELVGRVIRYEVTESFLNRGPTVGEADYVFPLPKGAAFEDLKLEINGELVSGETLASDKARGIYEDIVRRMRDPALVEWMGSGMLRTRIFPIAPGEEKHVVVRFQSVAEREGSAWRVDYVRGTAPRGRVVGGPMIDVAVDRDAAQRRNPDGERESSNLFVLTYPRSNDLGEPYSPTHELRTRDRSGNRVVTAVGDGREVTILLPLRRPDAASVTVLAHRAGDDEDGFALIAITPPAAPARTTPRDVTFVVDVSGSMRGEKLTQAKAAGRRLLESLGVNDRFRIIDFSTDVRSFRDGWSAVTSETVRAARRYLDDLRAEGSTNISGALDEALAARTSDGRLPLVVFVTDGEPTVGERNPDHIAALAARERGDARVFTFGVSADVNATLIEQLALEGRGTAHFVRPGESVERAVSLLATRLTSPVITDVRVHAEGVTLRQLQPQMPVDLYAGQDLLVLARYRGDGDARIRLDGRSATGDVHWTTRATFPERERGNPFVARLWAAQRLGWLAAEKRKNGGTTELDAEIRSLGERYGIPTEFSSYLVVEPGMQLAANAADVRRRAGQPMPAVAPDQMKRDGSLQLEAVVTTGSGTVAQSAPANEQRFEAAKEAAARREAKSLADLDEVGGRGDRGAGVRRVGTRVFALRGTVWTDARYVEGMRTVRVKAYSPLYFELVQKLAGLGEALGVGDEVIVAGRKVAVAVAADGAERLGERELQSLVDGW